MTEKPTLKPDLSHRLCFIEDADLEIQLFDAISIINGKLKAKLEILRDAISADTFSGNKKGPLGKYVYSLMDDSYDIESILSAYEDATKEPAKAQQA